MTNNPNTTNLTSLNCPEESEEIFWKAIHERVEFIADTLKIPSSEVEKAKQSEADMRDFIRRYKQSFDWVIDGDPSSMISWARTRARHRWMTS
jgi:hypothetical protein